MDYDALMRKTIGERISLLRIEHGESQADLAAAVDVSQGAIGHIERGIRAPSRKLLFRIAAHYRVSADWLELGIEAPDPALAEVLEAWSLLSPEAKDLIRLQIRADRARRTK